MSIDSFPRATIVIRTRTYLKRNSLIQCELLLYHKLLIRLSQCRYYGLMNSFSRRLRQHLESIGWGAYDICKHFKDLPKEERLSEQYIYALCRGDKEPKDSMVLERLSSVPGLELSLTTLQAWYIEPHYPPESIREANLLVSTPAPP